VRVFFHIFLWLTHGGESTSLSQAQLRTMDRS